MVKYHMKGKKKKGGKEEKVRQVSLEENLDRFAGSSDEDNQDGADEESSVNEESYDEIDNDEGSDVSSEEDEYDESGKSVPRREPKKALRQMYSVEEADDTDSEEEESVFENPEEKSQSGMADAMAKILGLPLPTKRKNKQVILSKTTTPLQKLQKKEKEQADALRLKRKQRRDVHLTSMHIPLSAATSRPILGRDNMSDLVAKSMAKEVEWESTHRRVATRGVVALFNTISKHQQQKLKEQKESGVLSKSSTTDIKAMTKHGFLDMLKKTGSSQTSKTESSDSGVKSAKGWNALKDDFMMNSKLKDWDKALSDDDESENDEENDIRGRKRGEDDDDIMEDDWSSEDSEDVPIVKAKKN